MLSRDSEDKMWSRFVFELVIWLQEVTSAIWTQPSGPLCLWQWFLNKRHGEILKDFLVQESLGSILWLSSFLQGLNLPFFLSSEINDGDNLTWFFFCQIFIFLCWFVMTLTMSENSYDPILLISALPWSKGWVALSFLVCLYVCSFVRSSGYGDTQPNLHFFSIYILLYILYIIQA